MKILLPVTVALCLVAGCASWLLPYDLQHVPAKAETEPMFGTADQADDPSLWVHPLDSSLSIILGTNKEGGLYIYNLAGEQQGILHVGRVNNVDVRGDLAVASNDQVNGLSWFRIRPTESGARVRHIGDTKVRRYEPYGVCLGIVAGELTVGVTYPNGAFEIWRASDNGSEVSKFLVRTEIFASQVEGCVFDDAGKRVFVGEEDHGVWSLDLADPASRPREVDTIAAGNGLVEDVEGVSLYAVGEERGYLVVSAQGADRFVLYDRQPPHVPRGTFRIVSSVDGSVDGVSHTDGIEASSVPMSGYPMGILIVQDDANPKIEKDQNFKLVDWRDVDTALALTAP
ncbi:MAG: phytase [Woeseiaceae bacterium]